MLLSLRSIKCDNNDTEAQPHWKSSCKKVAVWNESLYEYPMIYKCVNRRHICIKFRKNYEKSFEELN